LGVKGAGAPELAAAPCLPLRTHRRRWAARATERETATAAQAILSLSLSDGGWGFRRFGLIFENAEGRKQPGWAAEAAVVQGARGRRRRRRGGGVVLCACVSLTGRGGNEEGGFRVAVLRIAPKDGGGSDRPVGSSNRLIQANLTGP